MLDTAVYPRSALVCSAGWDLEKHWWYSHFGKGFGSIHLVDGTPGGHLAFGDGELPMKSSCEQFHVTIIQVFFSMEIAHRQYFMGWKSDEKSTLFKVDKWTGRITVRAIKWRKSIVAWQRFWKPYRCLEKSLTRFCGRYYRFIYWFVFASDFALCF